jgi:hypothetical protein
MARQDWHSNNSIASPDQGHRITGFNYLPSEFVTKYYRIMMQSFEAKEPVLVGTTNACRPDFY